MSAAAFVTLALLVKLEAPAGDVNLTMGGFVKFDAGAGEETYASEHATFGTLAEPDEFEAAFGDMAESGTLRLIPNPAAALGDWYSNDLLNARVRVWLAEVDTATAEAVDAAQVADQLVDTVSRVIGADGSVTLELGLIGRAEKLFLINQGNVCSERFHKSVWAGEDGFNNCTDVPQPVAWGIAAPPSGTTGSGGAGSGFGGGGFGSGDGGVFEVAR